MCTAGGAAAEPVTVTTGTQTLNGNAGGAVHAATMDPRCTGQVGDTPNHVLVLPSAMPQLTLSVEAGPDATLVVLGPGGTLCDDDTNGLNPALSGPFAAGTYSVFVGSYQGPSFPYTLTVSTEGQAVVPTADIIAGPEVTVSPGFMPDPMTVTSNGGGPTSGSAMFGSQCNGNYGGSPSQVVNVTADMPYLRFTAESETDLTIAVRGPRGVLCNDDTHGFNPEVSGAVAAGRYEVWVGTYSTTTPASFRLTMSASPHGAAGAVIPSGNTGAAVTLSPGFSPDPQILIGRSGGTVQASQYGTTPTGPCRGTIGAAPNHVFDVTAPMARFRFTVRSSVDTTLVVRGPSGALFCQDDSDGFNPEIRADLGVGRYEVFVGSYSSDGDYSLEVSSR
jgi:hypothetical protein